MPFEAAPSGRVRWPGFSHVVFDCDSTLSSVEGIDVLAASLGLEEEVASMTDAAMAGEVDLEEVYGARLAMLQPSRQSVAELRSAYKRHVVDDAREVIAALHELEIAVYIVSGGLAEPVEEFAIHLGVAPDNVRAVAARHDGLSGQWWLSSQGPVDQDYAGYDGGALTRSDGKADVIAALLDGKPGASMLVGDGASDLHAAAAVDLFVGFGGVVRREHVAAHAAVYVDAATLAPVLPIAAGPGGAERLESQAARRVFAKGAHLIETGAVTVRDARQREQLIATLSGLNRQETPRG